MHFHYYYCPTFTYFICKWISWHLWKTKLLILFLPLSQWEKKRHKWINLQFHNDSHNDIIPQTHMQRGASQAYLPPPTWKILATGLHLSALKVSRYDFCTAIQNTVSNIYIQFSDLTVLEYECETRNQMFYDRKDWLQINYFLLVTYWLPTIMLILIKYMSIYF